MARTKKGWLTGHDLRSGLKEQHAHIQRGNHLGVELSWFKELDVYHVATTCNGAVVGSLYTSSLQTARERFTKETRRICAPTIKEGASR